MAISQAELQDLPPLEEVMRTHRMGIGDVAMFAALSAEERQETPWAEMNAVLEPYIAAGHMAVSQTVKTPLTLVK